MEGARSTEGVALVEKVEKLVGKKRLLPTRRRLKGRIKVGTVLGVVEKKQRDEIMEKEAKDNINDALDLSWCMVDLCRSVDRMVDLSSVYSIPTLDRSVTLQQSWPLVFLSMAVYAGQVFPAAHVERLRILVKYFLDIVHPLLLPESSVEKERCAVLRLFSTSLLSYLETHEMDPNNCVVGLPPCRVAEECFYRVMTLKTKGKTGPDAGRSLLLSSSSKGYSEIVHSVSLPLRSANLRKMGQGFRVRKDGNRLGIQRSSRALPLAGARGRTAGDDTVT
eukprot:CAMPEP_0119129368 /NCGR_PEP_ID=MMETSP1310-20130426/7147_1 /TAXON_ID=464262 /ORGANISM="Genus nov. species nov., Strain RCC2339" /LENGTH=277 /DNA_ID=CAMNT_0007119787 /DNA_START=198 /DNA_END=1028 /DNA_ORIENTATION=+